MLVGSQLTLIEMIDDYGDDERFATDELRLERSLGIVEFIVSFLKRSKLRGKEEKRSRRGIVRDLLRVQKDLEALHAKKIFAVREAVALGQGIKPSDESH